MFETWLILDIAGVYKNWTITPVLFSSQSYEIKSNFIGWLNHKQLHWLIKSHIGWGNILIKLITSASLGLTGQQTNKVRENAWCCENASLSKYGLKEGLIEFCMN